MTPEEIQKNEKNWQTLRELFKGPPIEGTVVRWQEAIVIPRNMSTEQLNYKEEQERRVQADKYMNKRLAMHHLETAIHCMELAGVTIEELLTELKKEKEEHESEGGE